MYLELKLFHIACVFISLSLFSLRAVWMLSGSLQSRPSWIKALPHWIDTALLTSGLGLMYLTGFTPFNSQWLALKLCLLLIYIVCGAVALSYGRSYRGRCISLLFAVLSASGIVFMALIKPVIA